MAGLTDAVAQDETITNATQFASFLDQPGLSYPLVNVAEPVMFIPTYNMLWVDFAQLPDAIGEVRKYDGRTEYGVAMWPLRLIRSATGTRITYRGVTDLLELPAAPKDDFSTRYTSVLRGWCALTGKNYTSQKDLIAQGYSFLDPAKLVVDLYVADINDLPAYEANCAAEQAAADETRAQIASVSRSMLSGGMSLFGEESESFGLEAASYQTNFCQGIPVTAISKTTTNIRLNWISITNDMYAVQYADNMEWFNTWHLLGDNVTSASSNAVWDDVGILSSNVTKRFYRVVRKDASYGLPCVTVLTPTNSAVLAGNTGVQVYATDDSRISSITLMVDGKDFVSITNGPMNFVVPTSLFSNGVHSIAAYATDNAGIPGLGGDPNSSVVVNVATSETVQVTFQNDITLNWFEGFQSSLPIQANLSFSNANWTVTIASWAGTTVKTLTGSTSNGQINVTWDGTDTGSSPVPYDALYLVTISATQSGGGFGPLSGSTSVKFAEYRERTFATAQTFLARQKFVVPGAQAAAIAQLDSIKNWIAQAAVNADVWLGAPLEIAHDSDWNDLLTYLKDTPARNITQFYWYGHGSYLGIGFGNETTSSGLADNQVSITLSNSYVAYDESHSVFYANFRTPYKFVFLDGCNTAGTPEGDLKEGHWPAAFGIARNQMDYSTMGRKNRAFLGWNAALNAGASALFVESFFQNWTQDTTTRLDDALAAAHAAVPGAPYSNLVIFGFTGLRWED